MRVLKFSYSFYNFLLFPKISEVVIKKFIKFILFSRDFQKKRFFWERLGIISNVTTTNANGNWVWVHANAIGEVVACQPLIRLIKNKYPNKQILLTTSNFSADSKAHEFKIADKVMFFPYDIPFIIKRFLKIFNLACVMIIECDIWPNFIKICKQRKIPVVVASGVYTNGCSRSSGLRHLYAYRFRLSRDIFKNINFFSMQTEDDVKKLNSDFPDIRNAVVGGNLKLSCLNAKTLLTDKAYYSKVFNIKINDIVFIAGNVHKVECAIIIDAFMRAKEEIPEIIMIVAPRFIEQIPYIEAALKDRGLTYVKRTSLDDKQETVRGNIILLDTMGELGKVYSLARVAFVGGSLSYLGEMFGGHNILEPAQFGVPVIFGPYMHNFQCLADLFLREKIGTQVKNVTELASAIKNLIKDKGSREFTESKVEEILKASGDVTKKTFEFLSPFLNSGNLLTEEVPICEVCAGRDFKLIIKQDKYRIYRCKNCRLVLSYPLPDSKELHIFYDNFSYNQFEAEYVNENLEIGKYVIAKQLSVLRHYGADVNNGNFLDIGCGCGYYVYGAKENGLIAAGIDLDTHAVEFGIKNLEINICAKEIGECNFPDNHFDLINSRQLIEHLPNPLAFLKEVHRILKFGNLLVLETPNTDSLEHILKLYFLDTFKKSRVGTNRLKLKEIIKIIKREWGFVDPPRHIFGFNQHNLKMLCEKAGFKSVKIIRAMTGHKVYYPLSKGHSKFVAKSRREALRRLSRVSLPKFFGYVLFFMPAMFMLKAYIYFSNNGSHLIIYAKKE